MHAKTGITNLNIFTQAVDNMYIKDQSNENYYSYEGCDIGEIDKILNKSSISKIEEDEHEDNSTFADDEYRKLSSDTTKSKESVVENKNTRKLTDELSNNWVQNLTNLKKQVLIKIDKNNFLENGVKNRKFTFDYSKPSSIKKDHGFC